MYILVNIIESSMDEISHYYDFIEYLDGRFFILIC